MEIQTQFHHQIYTLVDHLNLDQQIIMDMYLEHMVPEFRLHQV